MINLSPAELKVLNLLRYGKRNKNIAEMLGISEKTVKFHNTRIMRKLNVKSRGELLAKIHYENIEEFKVKYEQTFNLKKDILYIRKGDEFRMFKSMKRLCKYLTCSAHSAHKAIKIGNLKGYKITVLKGE